MIRLIEPNIRLDRLPRLPENWPKFSVIFFIHLARTVFENFPEISPAFLVFSLILEHGQKSSTYFKFSRISKDGKTRRLKPPPTFLYLCQPARERKYKRLFFSFLGCTTWLKRIDADVQSDYIGIDSVWRLKASNYALRQMYCRHGNTP